MKRFKFPLRSLTTLRGWRESQAREVFGAKLRLLREAETSVQQAREKLAQTERAVREARCGRVLPGEQVAFMAAFTNDQTAVTRAETARDEARGAADRAREAWQARRSELRVIHQLEHRARQTHRLAEERAEQAVLDELASLRATRLSAPLS